ncbi:HNH endonuclease [Romboutsia hominis]|uniref:HNH endonuclease n=1 Tax=Romboutsia hominis TaxID=1507512 RepID=UPI000B834A45|nr:HNH endonuclease signature motif containing protein [Romboutsia hominis]
MLKKFCRCGKIITQDIKMCNDCEKRFSAEKKKSYKDYRKRRNDLIEQKFYRSDDWIFTRDSVKQRDDGMCKLCERKHSDVVHHIEPLKEAWSLRFNIDNLICLCNRCHYYVHKKYDKGGSVESQMKSKLTSLIDKKY